MRNQPRPLVRALLTLCLAMATFVAANVCGVAAAEPPTFPQGSRLGLVPPPGFGLSRDFTGFEAPDLGASIILSDLPGNVYDEVGAGFTAQELAARSMTLIGPCGPLDLAADHRCYLAGQTTNNQPYRKWLVLVRYADATAYVIVNVPEAVLKDGPLDAAAIDASLSTLAFAPTTAGGRSGAGGKSGKDPRDSLPFSIREGNLLPFRQTLGDETAVFARPADDDDGPQALLVVAAGGEAISTAPKAVAKFARDALKSTTSITDVKLADSWSTDIGPFAGYLQEGSARDRNSGHRLFVLQAVLVDRSGNYFRVFGVAPEDERPTFQPEFVRLIETLRPR